jgi:ubiquinone/menaquinone biosynthesis C-methylase UbiE
VSASAPAQDPTAPAQYDGWARVYDRLWRRYMNQTLPVIRQTAAVTDDERVLDLACGTGELLYRIAQRPPQAELVGVDLASGMVDRARQKLSGTPRAQVQQADGHDLPFADNAFDAILCANTFHYFTHPSVVLAEGRRVLRPEGRLVLLDWCRDFWTCRLMDVVLRQVDPAYETCHTLAEMTSLLGRASFRVTESFRYRFDVVWGMMVVTAVPIDA